MAGRTELGRPLMAQTHDSDSLPALAVVLFPPVMGAWLTLSGPITANRLGFGATFTGVLAIFLWLIMYPLSVMRARVWEGGFRPRANQIWPIQWIRTGFRTTFLWGEVKQVSLMPSRYSGEEQQLRVQVPGYDDFLFAISHADSRSESSIALLILERWLALGGPVLKGKF